MERNKGTVKELVIVFAVLFVCLLVAALCALDASKPEGYELLFLLPLVYGISFTMLSFRYQMFHETFRTMTGIVILVLYFIRMVATPAVMYVGKYASIIGDTFCENYPIAILMISIECFVIFLYLPYRIHKTIAPFEESNLKYRKKRFPILRSSKPRFWIWMVVLGMVAFILYFVITDDTVVEATFLLLVDSGKEYHALSETEEGIGTLSMYVEIICMLYKVLQVLLPPMLLWKVIHSEIPEKMKYAIAFVVFGLVAIVATEDRIDALFAALALLNTLRIAFGERFSGQFKKWIMMIMLIGVFGLSIKSGVIGGGSGGESGFSSISGMLSAYFSGVPTVSAGFSMMNAVSGTNLLHIPVDIVNRVPFFSYAVALFTGITLIDSNQIFNFYIADQVGQNLGQILPTTAIGYEYFFIFYPVLPCLMIRLACEFEKKANEQTDIVRLNLINWITICVAGSTVVASSLLISAKLFWFTFSWTLLTLFNKRRYYLQKC